MIGNCIIQFDFNNHKATLLECDDEYIDDVALTAVDFSVHLDELAELNLSMHIIGKN